MKENKAITNNSNITPICPAAGADPVGLAGSFSPEDAIKLDNQLCFPLYAAAREVIKYYRPILDDIDLTYTQYIAMMVMWESKAISVKEMGEKLFLDSGTLTPVLKALEKKGMITRNRSKEDERVLIVEITKEGEALKEKALAVPEAMQGCIDLPQEELLQLKYLLEKALIHMDLNTNLPSSEKETSL